jgi:hypothetical protein
LLNVISSARKKNPFLKGIIMLRDQYGIELQVSNSPYTEYVLDPMEVGKVLPGAIVSLYSIIDGTPTAANTNQPWGGATPQQIAGPPNAQADGLLPGRIQSQAGANGAPTIGEIEPIIVIDNRLLGRSMNHVARPGEVIPSRRLVSGDIVLIRCVTGTYHVGQPLYLTQTPNGMYVTGTKPTGDAQLLGYAQENFVVDSNMVDLIDDSNSDFPTTRGPGYYINGMLVNLLRVRIK